MLIMGLSSISLIFVFCIILKVCNADIIFYTCNFEQGRLCPQLSTQNNVWKVNQYATPEDGTGPSQGADGSIWYIYFDSTNAQSGSLVYTQDTTLPSTTIVLSFKVHAYGANCVKFNVLFKDTSGAVINVSNPIVLYNQLQTSYASPYTLYTFNMTSSFQKIEFVATSNGVQANYAIDDISLTAVTTCSSFCHPNATCLSENCVCNSGFTGDGVNNCTATCPVACNSNATCEETTCVCKNGFIGDGVTNCTATCTSACNPNATCVGTTCVCKNGFIGDGISNCTATCASACNPNATCVGTTCVCNNGFIGDGISNCTATCASPCNPNATCVGTTCVCNDAFIGDGVVNCTATCASACNPNATCVGTTCVCNNGFIGDGISNCTATCASPCNPNATCVGTTCVCNDAFIGDGVVSCTATCASACNPNATCVGTTCVCNDAFIGDGVVNCTATCASACNPNATCVGTTCVCKNGFIGDGVSNCTVTCDSACNPNATCVGTTCVCKNGFIGDGISNCTATCASACNPNATCVGTTCVCNNGFIGDGISNCTATCSSACNSNATCIGTTCVCNSGYFGDGINSCTVSAICSSCHPNATCNGTACVCKNGYNGDGINSCIGTCSTGGFASCSNILLYNCDFEKGVICSQLSSTNGAWKVNSFGTPLDGTGPFGAANGLWYIYFDSVMYPNGGTLVYTQTNSLLSNSFILSFNLHAFGVNCIQFEIKFKNANGVVISASNAFVVYNQTQMSSTVAYTPYNLQFNLLSPFQTIEFIATSNGQRANYAIDNIVLKAVPPCLLSCNSNATCNGITCVCNPGFIGDGVSSCTATCATACNPNATCVGTTCVCNKGFIGDGLSNCTPTCAIACNPNATCVGTTCVCNKGFNGDGINNCTAACATACNPNATCVGTACVCNKSFIGDGINNCTATCSSTCHLNATCVGTTCICENGLLGDGINNCTVPPSCPVCHPNATCNGSTCICKTGYNGDGINSCIGTCSTGGFASCSNILLYNCDFEKGVICSQLSSTNGAWKVNSFGTPLDGTGPFGAANGLWYIYFDSVMYPNGGTLVYTQTNSLLSNSFILSFNLHAFGVNCIQFEIKFKNANGVVISASNAFVVYNQTQMSSTVAYTPYNLQFNLLSPFQTIEFIATSNGQRANYAIDNIVLKAVPPCLLSCNSNATCNGTTCVCNPGFIGDGVNSCTATCATACNSNATCVGTTCVCKNGFIGDGINNCTATCSSACNPNATCVDTSCVCKNGFIGDGINNCTATCSSACNPNATCVDTTCVCKNGFIGDGINNCTATCSSACNPNATCVDTTCVCKNGFIGDGINNCTATCSSACNPNATCVDTTCVCKNGFIGDGINNCTATCSSACNPNATCVDTTCVCKNGFIGDGINNCTATCSSACNPNATCVDTTCVCKNGFIGDGINNCTATCSSACNPNATCVDTTCVCKNGFIGDGINNCTATCATACNPNASCVGTSCVCNKGFIGDGVSNCSATCLSICSPNARCIGTTCVCNDGFVGDGINNCTVPINCPVCHPNATCNGTTCICKTGYNGDGISSCIGTCSTGGLASCSNILLYNCDFEQGVLCSQLNSTNDAWKVNSFGTPLDGTGPSGAANGQRYVYFDSVRYPNGGTLVYTQIKPLPSNSFILSFNLHAFGVNCIQFEIKFKNANGVVISASNAFVVYNQTQMSSIAPYTPYNLEFDLLSPFQTIEFIVTSNGPRANYAIDNIVLKAIPPCLISCNSNAMCNGTTCVCKAGFIGDGVNSCTATCSSACHSNATCVDTTCVCKNGFFGDGVNSCTATCSSACNPNATCVGTTCICKNGFIGDGINNCTATCSSACNPNATCVGTTCICNTGFVGDGINSCTATCPTCNPNATCVGSTCVCNKGFIGDGVNQCAVTCANVCHPNAICDGTNCICKSGFFGDGVTNCAVSCQGTCNPNAFCSGATCICKNGFIGDGVVNCSATCSNVCHPNAFCQGTTCVCNNGFVGDGVNTCYALPISLTDWGSWSACIENVCGNGVQSRQRSCLAQCGAVLQSDLYQVISCQTSKCFNNTLTQWSGYSDCSATCGSNGVRTRYRTCSPLVQNGCVGIALTDFISCEQLACPQVGVTDWSGWTGCSSSCINTASPSQWRWRSCSCDSCSQCDNSVTVVDSRTCNNVPCDSSCRSSMISYIIVIDSSSSVSDYYWQLEKSFVKKFAASVGFTSNTTFGLVNFASSARTEFGCRSFTDATSFNTALDSVAMINGGTAINAGLTQAINLMQSSDCRGKKVLLFTTDGQENIETDPLKISATYQTVRSLANYIYIPYVNNPDVPSHPDPVALDLLVANGKGSDKEFTYYSDVNDATYIPDLVLSGLCMDNSAWTSWSSYSQCSISCGGTGFTYRQRTCLNGGNVATNCPGADYDVSPCYTSSCSYLTNWNSWSDCSSSCRQNLSTSLLQVRTRSCVQNIAPCQGVLLETRECNTNLFCGGSWGNWGPYSACSATCSLGSDYSSTMVRSRLCLNDTFYFGCVGSSIDIAPCNNQIGCPGILTVWSTWSGCEGQCQQDPLTSETRIRRCVDASSPFNCNGTNLIESRNCFEGLPCQGSWNSWSNWTSCSQSCLISNLTLPFQSRNRVCVGSTLTGNCYGGKSSEIQTCNTNFPCPGQWSEWGPYTPCSETCQNNVLVDPKQVRRRVCLNAALGGACEGSAGSNEQYQTIVCNRLVICPVMGTWTLWSAWSACSSSCDMGFSTRTRVCTQPNIPSAGNDCVGSWNQTTSCNNGDCPKYCNIPKSCNCSQVPQFNNFTTFLSFNNMNMTSVDNVLLRLSPWTVDYVNETLESCNIPRLTSSLDRLMQDILALNMVKTRLEMLINNTQFAITCNSNIPITNELWNYFDYLYERVVFLTAVNIEFEAFRIRYDAAISACKQYGWFHQLLFNVAQRYF
ncbi:uncharacterized protein LOC100210856 isoform X52 [Hydra vulgaris]|uniref:Uncharacterized protein LOC100210856 isoform X52 n=1 Tax=Hydra vulgaris TaxID=6087 RepID=A0ABM4C678_HYDVU